MAAAWFVALKLSYIFAAFYVSPDIGPDQGRGGTFVKMRISSGISI
jgi:hypothetical protein